MPYVISRNDQGEYCVYKRDADGQPMGETLGCHTTRNAAGAQIGAIERSEGTKMDGQNKQVRMLTQRETNYMTVSARLGAGEACASCRWYCDEECRLVEGYPATIEPTGVCDRFEAVPVEEIPDATLLVEGDVTVVEVSNEERAAKDGNERTGEKPATNTPGGILGAIKSFFGVGGSEPGSSVFKALGNGIWFAAYTNNLLDLEGEILKEAAHDRYIARVDAKFIPLPQLWHVHEPATKHGEATHVWRDGHVVIAVGKFDDTPAGRAAEKFYRSRKDGEIELSHGFQYPKWAKSIDGVYEDYSTFEISTIYTKYGRAANPFTSFEEIETMALTEQKKQSIIEFFGKDEAARMFALSEKMATRAKALTDAGVAYKGDFVDLTDTVQKPTPQPEAVKAVMGDVLEGQDMVLTALEQTKAAFETVTKALEAQKAALATREKALDGKIAELQALIDAKPRRVDDGQGNVVTTDPDASKALEAAAGVEYDPHYPGMQVPLKKS